MLIEEKFVISSLWPACSQLMDYGYHNHSVWNVSRRRRCCYAVMLFPVSATCSGQFGMFGHWTYGMNRSNVNSNIRLSWTVPTAWEGARGAAILPPHCLRLHRRTNAFDLRRGLSLTPPADCAVAESAACRFSPYRQQRFSCLDYELTDVGNSTTPIDNSLLQLTVSVVFLSHFARVARELYCFDRWL